MIRMFRKYDFIILDASYFLLKEMNGELIEFLRELVREKRVRVSCSFEAEREAYRVLLSEERRKLYDAFTRELPRFSEFSDGTRSAWEMVSDASFEGKTVAVVTGNRLFMERMILEPVKADIFDLNHLKWISYDDFPVLRERIELRGEKFAGTPPPPKTIQDGTALYQSNGERVTLRELGENRVSGAESYLYGLQVWRQDSRQDSRRGDSDIIGVAKIFRTGSLTPEKRAHLLRITEEASRMNIDAQWAFFPTDTLYYNKTRQNLAGIQENYSQDSDTLFELALRRRGLYAMTLSENLRLCRNIVRQICFLNHYGFFISDFNTKNFAVRKDGPDHDRVLMFDTDSFGFQNYFSGFRAAGIQTANLYDTKTKKGALGFCDDSLYAFIFFLLSQGSQPIYVDQNNIHIFRFDEKDEIIKDGWRKNLFPEKIWRLFANAFRNRKNFSAEILLAALSESLNHVTEHPEEDFEYAEKIEYLIENAARRKSEKKSYLTRIARFFESGALDRVLFFLILFAIVIVYFLSFGFSG